MRGMRCNCKRGPPRAASLLLAGSQGGVWLPPLGVSSAGPAPEGGRKEGLKETPPSRFFACLEQWEAAVSPGAELRTPVTAIPLGPLSLTPATGRHLTEWGNERLPSPTGAGSPRSWRTLGCQRASVTVSPTDGGTESRRAEETVCRRRCVRAAKPSWGEGGTRRSRRPRGPLGHRTAMLNRQLGRSLLVWLPEVVHFRQNRFQPHPDPSVTRSSVLCPHSEARGPAAAQASQEKAVPSVF